MSVESKPPGRVPGAGVASVAGDATGQRENPAIPPKPRRRGRARGFVPGSQNDVWSHEIPRVLGVWGPQPVDEIALCLGCLRSAWTRKVVQRLLEEGTIAKSRVRVLGRFGEVKEVEVLHLPGEDPMPIGMRALAESVPSGVGSAPVIPACAADPAGAALEPTPALPSGVTDDADCAACAQLPPGRSRCARCEREAADAAAGSKRKRGGRRP